MADGVSCAACAAGATLIALPGSMAYRTSRDSAVVFSASFLEKSSHPPPQGIDDRVHLVADIPF